MIEKLVWWVVYVPHWVLYHLGLHGKKGAWGVEWFALMELYGINRSFGLKKEIELYELSSDDFWDRLTQVFPDMYFGESFEGNGKNWFYHPSEIEVDNYFREYSRRLKRRGEPIPENIRRRFGSD